MTEQSRPPEDDPAPAAVEPAAVEPAATSSSEFGRWMGSMWLYTVLRFGMFFALWGLMVLVGLSGLVAALVALLLSVPLSLVLLAKPRAAFSRQLDARLAARSVHRAELATRLQDDDTA